MFSKISSILQRGSLFLVVFFAGMAIFGIPVFGAESPSFRLDAQVGSAEGSVSSAYSLCSRFSPVGVQGDSSTFKILPSLNCATEDSEDEGGGGSHYHYCGNGSIDFSEQCDDGNTLSGDGCSDTCTVEVPGPGGGGSSSVCGNTILEFGEQCDDGNTSSSDGCSAVCVNETACGNSVLEAGEQCDDGNQNNNDGCSLTCQDEEDSVPPDVDPTVCGNAVRELGEQCDDGNASNEDGCNSLCRLERDPEVEPPLPEVPPFTPVPPSTPIPPVLFIPETEILRPSAPNLSDFFSGSLFSFCGNSVREQGEQCDDGNTRNGDGCTSICQREFAGASEEPSEVSPGSVYVTNDLSTLFFEQFPNGSGNFSVTLRSSEKEYEVKVLDTIDGYFSFQVLEEIPDDVYQIVVTDLEQPDLSRTMYLQIKQNETIYLPYEMTFGVQDLVDEVPQGFPVYEVQPILKGKATLAATIAIYSSNLEKTFIAFTDDEHAFEFEYPEKLVLGSSESLFIVVHYENGYVSREQEITFQLEETKGGAFISKGISPQIYLGFIFFFVAFVSAFISAVWSSFLKDQKDRNKGQVLWKRVSLTVGKILIVSAIASVILFSFLMKTMAFTTTPNILPYEGILKTAGGTAITTSHDFRFSVWLDGDFNAGVDRDGGGAIPGAAPGYSSYVEVRTITPDSSGFFQVNIGEVTPIPDFNTTTHLYLQVEIKTTGAPDTSYETLDIDGVDNATDRQAFGTIPYARNSDFIDNAELGTSDGNIVQLGAGDVFPVSVIPGGTNVGTFEIDSDNTGGVTQLSFGDVLNNQILSFDPDGVAVADGWFNFSDDVNIDGDLTINGTINGVTIGPVNRSIQYQPEYPNVIYDSIGPGDHKGKMEIFYIDTDGAAAPENFNSYKWTTNQATLQDKDLVVRFRIPDGFISWQATPITLRYRTEDGVLVNNKIDVSIEDTTGTLIGTLTGNSDLVSTTFTTTNIVFGGGGTFAVGSEITLFIKMSALDIGAAYVSDVNFHYIGN
jgi:cysteine-rich repeat protein